MGIDSPEFWIVVLQAIAIVIVIGPHGVSTIRSLLLGSVTNKVVQFSTTPVLLVK